MGRRITLANTIMANGAVLPHFRKTDSIMYLPVMKPVREKMRKLHLFDTEENYPAFTLAETMVVLVVLGIISAITIPSLVKRQIEATNRAKIKKAMSVYDTLLNKIVIENEIKTNKALEDWAGEDCSKPRQYFKSTQDGADNCTFQTSDGVWWNISDITNPLISLSKDGINPNDLETLRKTSKDSKNKDVFSFVATIDGQGVLKVDDINTEISQENQAYLTKLYNFINLSERSKAKCKSDDVVCLIKNADEKPLDLSSLACSDETVNCLQCEDFEGASWCYVYGDNEWIGDYITAVNPSTGELYTSSAYIQNSNGFTTNNSWSVNPNTGELYKSYETIENSDGSTISYGWSANLTTGELYKSYEKVKDVNGNENTKEWAVNSTTGQLYQSSEEVLNEDGSYVSKGWAANSVTGEVYQSKSFERDVNNNESLINWGVDSTTGEVYKKYVQKSVSTSWGGYQLCRINYNSDGSVKEGSSISQCSDL